MSERNCPPLVIALLGFLLGVIVVKLAEWFCPWCHGESCCCDGGRCCCHEGGPCTCEEDEAEAAAEGTAEAAAEPGAV